MHQLLLDRNENRYGPSPACYEVLREANLRQLSFYSREYMLGRKSALSYRLSEDIGIPEERVLLSYGSEDMLKQVVHCYLQDGQTMLLPRQSWWYYKALAAEVFGNHVEYSLKERNHTFDYDVEEILTLYEVHRPQLILIASPNNPTGNCLSPECLKTLVNYCTSSVIVLDEAYAGFSGDSNGHLKALLDSHKRLVVLRTFSKYYALAGLRVGYACVGEELTHLINFSARYLGYNQLTEKIAIAALDEKEYYKSITRRMIEDKKRYYQELGSAEGFTTFHSDANFILVRYPVPHRKTLEAELKRRGIIVKFLDDPGLEDCIRITIGTSEENTHVISTFKEIAADIFLKPVHMAAGQP